MLKKILCALFSILLMTTNTTYALSAYEFEFTAVDGTPMPLKQYKGKVLLIVNTASKCGFTPQLGSLETLYQRYKDKGLVVLGVPSPDFANQEFADPIQIAQFATDKYDITFPLTEPNHVSKSNAHPLYKWAYSSLGYTAIPRWNFHKLLIDRKGQLIAAFNSPTLPTSPKIMNAIQKALHKK